MNTSFDARDRLAGRLDNTTVRQAVLDTTLVAETPTPNGRRIGEEAHL